MIHRKLLFAHRQVVSVPFLVSNWKKAQHSACMASATRDIRHDIPSMLGCLLGWLARWSLVDE